MYVDKSRLFIRPVPFLLIHCYYIYITPHVRMWTIIVKYDVYMSGKVKEKKLGIEIELMAYFILFYPAAEARGGR